MNGGAAKPPARANQLNFRVGGVRRPGRSKVGWAGDWKMFRGLHEASCCARGRARSGMASSHPPAPAISEFGFESFRTERARFFKPVSTESHFYASLNNWNRRGLPLAA